MFSHALDEENVKLSKYKLLKYVNLKTSYNVDIVCESCCNYIGRQNSLPSSVQCSECKTSINTTKTKSYFVTLNMEEQIKSFVEKKTINERIFEREDTPSSCSLSDIYDGNMYKSLVNVDNRDITYTFNTDGCQSAKSSKTSVWPLYVKINELPVSMRFKECLILGLWVQKKKSDMNSFLRPFLTDANRLATKGFKWTHKGIEVNSKAFPSICCVDTPARSSVLNMKNFNGYYGCTFCQQRGTIAGIYE